MAIFVLKNRVRAQSQYSRALAEWQERNRDHQQQPHRWLGHRTPHERARRRRVDHPKLGRKEKVKKQKTSSDSFCERPSRVSELRRGNSRAIIAESPAATRLPAFVMWKRH